MVIQKVSFVNCPSKDQSIAVGVYENGELSNGAKKIDEMIDGEIAKNVKKVEFSGKLFESFYFVTSSDHFKYIFVIGLGERGKKFTKFEMEKLGANVYSITSKFDERVAIAIDAEDIVASCERCRKSVSALVAFGTLLRSWDFDKYRPSKSEKIKLLKVQFVTEDAAEVEKEFSSFNNLAEAIFLTRTLVSEPANVVYPASMAGLADKELAKLGVMVEILGKEEMERLGMNALLGVAQGSANSPRLVVLRWNGGDVSEKPIAFVGKGVTFDSGGISLKPGDNMHEMRHDMAGAGAVIGLLKAVALNKLPLNVVGVLPLVENMPSGAAQRPGDIIKSMSGQTIEVLNTDAEGRLILADALWYTQSTLAPKMMIDLATLTGAVVVALGHEFAALLSNDDDLAEKIKQSSERTGEKVWRMPMTEHFDRGIDSEIADMQNIGKPSVRGGTITAAQFLKRFVNGVSWAHLDIAGVESTSNDLFICAKGATGFGVHLLYDFLCENYVK